MVPRDCKKVLSMVSPNFDEFLAWSVPISMSEMGLTCRHDCHMLGFTWVTSSRRCVLPKLTSSMLDTDKASKNLKKRDHGERSASTSLNLMSNIGLKECDVLLYPRSTFAS
jgi:hypothetical protein